MPRTPDDIFDEMLILRIQDGEREALRTLVERWQPRLMRQAVHLIHDTDAAADCVQETWLAIVRGIPRLRDPAVFRGYAFRILSNKSADWIRQQRRSKRNTNLQESNEPIGSQHDLNTEQMNQQERLAATRIAIKQLSLEQRETLHLFYREGMSVQSIATALCIPPGTVKSRLHSAREQLRTLLSPTDQTSNPERTSHEPI